MSDKTTTMPTVKIKRVSHHVFRSSTSLIQDVGKLAALATSLLGISYSVTVVVVGGGTHPQVPSPVIAATTTSKPSPTASSWPVLAQQSPPAYQAPSPRKTVDAWSTPSTRHVKPTRKPTYRATYTPKPTATSTRPSPSYTPTHHPTYSPKPTYSPPYSPPPVTTPATTPPHPTSPPPPPPSTHDTTPPAPPTTFQTSLTPSIGASQ